MAVITETVKQMDGYKLHTVHTDKFKTNTLVWKMKAPLDSHNLTKRALLPYVLQANSKKYPTTAALRSYLDELYGATFYVDLVKKGEYHCISLAVEIANERFLSNSAPLLATGLEFLAEMINHPNVTAESFDEKTVEQEKRSQKARIQSVFDDKMKYSNARLVEEMCKGEPYSLETHGKSAEVDGITGHDLYAYFQQALIEDELDLYVIGDIDPAQVEEIAKTTFSFPSRTPKPVMDYTRAEVQEKTVIEKQDVKQGKLNIGYRTNITYSDDDYFALQVFNGIFGGFSHSKLFINVREKASLAYYAASRVESHKGLMMVMSGIDHKNLDQAVTIIKEQMKAMQDGDFSEDDITQTKAVITNQLLETLDTARGMVEILYHNVVSGKSVGLEEWLGRIQTVTKEEIMNVAKKIQLDTIYFLTGQEGNE